MAAGPIFSRAAEAASRSVKCGEPSCSTMAGMLSGACLGVGVVGRAGLGRVRESDRQPAHTDRDEQPSHGASFFARCLSQSVHTTRRAARQTTTQCAIMTFAR